MNIIINNSSMQPIYEQIVEQIKEIEQELDAIVRKGKSYGMKNEELNELFQLILEEQL